MTKAREKLASEEFFRQPIIALGPAAGRSNRFTASGKPEPSSLIKSSQSAPVSRNGTAAERMNPSVVCCAKRVPVRSEEHTSELQSRGHLVCRLLLEKKKKKQETDA